MASHYIEQHPLLVETTHANIQSELDLDGDGNHTFCCFRASVRGSVVQSTVFLNPCITRIRERGCSSLRIPPSMVYVG
jgi:hypothetical protein